MDTADELVPQHANCLIDPQVPIYTVDGWKPIGKIKVGDLVLTHKGKFRKVTQLHKNNAKAHIVKIFFDKNKFITVTAKHPVLVNGKWKNAKDITIDDSIKVLAHKCNGCNELIPIYKKYCTLSCSNKTTAKNMQKNYNNEYKFIDMPVKWIHSWVSKKNNRLYNLSVEGDESYICKGVVVHNCRCTLIPILYDKYDYSAASNTADAILSDLY